MSGTGSRSRVVTRTARPDDLPAVLSLVRQHRADAHAEDVLTGHTRLNAAASGFRRLLEDPGHRVVLAVLPGPSAPGGGARGEVAVGLAVLGLDPLSLVLGNPQVTVDTFVVHREHRRCGTGARLLAAAAGYAQENGAAHVVAAVGGHEAERQRFFARMGFAPLSTRRIVALDSLVRSLAAWQRSGLPVPAPRRALARRRPNIRPVPSVAALVAEG
ncbi:GNAT family N-acetyltransferase [Blastococcus sp. CT_GayMR20]|uniref:GNAT family N-acetyltransferase n=1 Tax=Blastococcus sp. CT_GayMR20 TaxID=2559609 RepID=UPI001430516C|nr:GNAT family N-acetyltransferase [Blastococcus sp. CT_GayMR20]